MGQGTFHFLGEVLVLGDFTSHSSGGHFSMFPVTRCLGMQNIWNTYSNGTCLPTSRHSNVLLQQRLIESPPTRLIRRPLHFHSMRRWHVAWLFLFTSIAYFAEAAYEVDAYHPHNYCRENVTHGTQSALRICTTYMQYIHYTPIHCNNISHPHSLRLVWSPYLVKLESNSVYYFVCGVDRPLNSTLKNIGRPLVPLTSPCPRGFSPDLTRVVGVGRSPPRRPPCRIRTCRAIKQQQGVADAKAENMRQQDQLNRLVGLTWSVIVGFTTATRFPPHSSRGSSNNRNKSPDYCILAEI
ncbi:hypothetical protein ACRALDRAFT_208206 [Sodiomyces alcalophilus JCM 7366]|uniref:uncharacterized protein n=1 Tax=Sodiomyces alcalophilus JCM 7366 TaxID=591952 RepID=UPI0039B6CB79